MKLVQSFIPVTIDTLVEQATHYKEEGYRLAQLHPVLKQDDTIELFYTFIKGADVVNLKLSGVIKGETKVPSLTPLFIAVFVNENEAHDLFGVCIEGNLIDFEGQFYSFGEGVEAPMTIISPAQLAAREKAAKIAAAKAAKEAKAKAAPADPQAELEAEIAAKTAGLDPEKAEKVRAAMIAKAKRQAQTAASKEGE